MLKLKRIYDPPSSDDGKRILVDRMWPRGVSKEKAALDRWAKELAPSLELCKWFGHDPERWKEFQARYHKEMQANKEELSKLAQAAKKDTVTLLYGARDEKHNQALVLKEALEKL